MYSYTVKLYEHELGAPHREGIYYGRQGKLVEECGDFPFPIYPLYEYSLWEGEKYQPERHKRGKEREKEAFQDAVECAIRVLKKYGRAGLENELREKATFGGLWFDAQGKTYYICISHDVPGF